MVKFQLPIYLMICFSCIGQTSKDYEQIQDILPENLIIYDSKEGDINLDGIPDKIIVCQTKGSTKSNKPVLIFFGLNGGGFELKGRNDHLAFDNYSGIAVTRNYFTIENRLGTNVTYSNYNHTFKVIKNNILFHRYDDAVYEVLDWNKGAELNSIETTRASEMGNPTFEQYKNNSNN